MTNECLLFISAGIDIVFVFCVARFLPQRLFGAVVLNLLLISIFGSKMVPFFNITTNAGNVFYACIFLATYFLLERNSVKSTYSVITVGILSVIFFTLLSQIVLHFSVVSGQETLSQAFFTVFSPSPRIVCASLIAYTFAQYINIRIYSYLQNRFKGSYLFLRSNGANIVAQLVDSCIFFSIAFVDVSGTVLLQAIISGWLIKIFVVFLGTPFLYIDAYFLKKHAK
jgi:uncharacterized integral membrane protein (TIGR00697 family)